MNSLSRRHFLYTSLGVSAATLIAPDQSHADAKQIRSQSGLVSGQPMPMRYQSIPGFLSETQLSPHYTAHYGGALKGYLAADQQLHSNSTDDTVIDSRAFVAIQRARTTKADSVLLHELYFDGMTTKPGRPGQAILAEMKKRFGSYDKWAADFQACASAASGWAVLARHSVNGKLYNVISDQHATGVLWMAMPFLVIDTYEHAYYVDYKNNKKQYIEKFMDHIDWNVIQQRYQQMS